MPSAVSPPRRYHPFRMRIHLVCFLIFVALPFFNVMRFDIPKQRFYFAGQELWINEFAIIFFTLMFLLFTIAGASMLYGRVYCSYLCPQMIFGEAAARLEQRIRKFVTKHFIQWPALTRDIVSTAAFYAMLLPGATFLAFVFISYFVEPRDLVARLLSFDIITAGGIAGAVTTLLTFFDFAFLRQRFCTSVCPYGYLQGMLSDKQTLLVVYRDSAEKKVCIECKKCVRVCHMGIDIRKSPYQIECIHCGECVEACDDVLARLKKPGLIHYAWGESAASGKESWSKRIGLRDAKRVVVLAVLVFYASGLGIALSMRHAVQVRINPDRSTLFTVSGSEVSNRFRVNIDNRSSNNADVALAIEGLPNARMVLPRNPVSLKGGESVEVTFEVVAARPAPGVSRFRLKSIAYPQATETSFDTTFIAPEK